MKSDQANKYCPPNQVSVKSGLNIYSLIGFWMSILSLLISLSGIIALTAVIVSFIGLTKTKVEDSRGKVFAFSGTGIGLLSLTYAYFML